MALAASRACDVEAIEVSDHRFSDRLQEEAFWFYTRLLNRDRNETRWLLGNRVSLGLITLAVLMIPVGLLRPNLAFNPPIECQPAKLGQVFMNLIVNACEACLRCDDGRAGVVSITTSSLSKNDHPGRFSSRESGTRPDSLPKDQALAALDPSSRRPCLGQPAVFQQPTGAAEEFVQIEVADNGCGMDAGTLERVFEPFFTTKSVGAGTGLGLAICHGIVREHGGRIEVESSTGAGSRFVMRLPRNIAA